MRARTRPASLPPMASTPREPLDAEGAPGGSSAREGDPPDGAAKEGGGFLKRWYDRVDDWLAIPSGVLLLAFGIPGVKLVAAGREALGVPLLVLALITGAFAIVHVLVEVVSQYVLLPLMLLALPLMLIPAFRRRFRAWAARQAARTPPSPETPPPAEP